MTHDDKHQDTQRLTSDSRARSMDAPGPPGAISMEQFRAMLVKAPPGAVQMGMPVDAETFREMRKKKGLTSDPIKIGSNISHQP